MEVVNKLTGEVIETEEKTILPAPVIRQEVNRLFTDDVLETYALEKMVKEKIETFKFEALPKVRELAKQSDKPTLKGTYGEICYVEGHLRENKVFNVDRLLDKHPELKDEIKDYYDTTPSFVKESLRVKIYE